ncbi:MAG TPA: C39 family peptidase [Terriglobales bacterium]|nr:C39 family peptidase [Terriglobales bacterium]
MRLRFIQAIAAVVCLSAMLAASGPAEILLDVPFIPQEKDGCGAASIAMVMQYWQHEWSKPLTPGSDPALIQRALYSPEAHGIYASQMESYFRQQNFRTFIFRGQWADLKQHLQKGRPLIVALKPGGDSPLHYVVVAGLDEEKSLVLVNDPAQRKLLKQDRANFEREWSAADRWTLLALPILGPS